MAKFDLSEYVDVQTRISRFWQEYPDGAIRTELASPSDDFTTCRYRAEVYKSRDNMHPDATGYAFEVAGGHGPNATSHEENGETSAIGRALANLGYATSLKDRPSRQEMEKVERHQGEPTSIASQRELAALHATAGEHGITHDQIKAWVTEKGYESTKDVPSAEIGRLTRALKDQDNAARFAQQYPEANNA